MPLAARLWTKQVCKARKLVSASSKVQGCPAGKIIGSNILRRSNLLAKGFPTFLSKAASRQQWLFTQGVARACCLDKLASDRGQLGMHNNVQGHRIASVCSRLMMPAVQRHSWVLPNQQHSQTTARALLFVLTLMQAFFQALQSYSWGFAMIRYFRKVQIVVRQVMLMVSCYSGDSCMQASVPTIVSV